MLEETIDETMEYELAETSDDEWQTAEDYAEGAMAETTEDDSVEYSGKNDTSLRKRTNKEKIEKDHFIRLVQNLVPYVLLVLILWSVTFGIIHYLKNDLESYRLELYEEYGEYLSHGL